MTGPLTCIEVVELVTDYLEGALSRRDRRRFEAHIAGCEHCTRYLGQMRRTLAMLGSLEVQTLPEAAREDLVAAFREWR